MDPYLTMNSQTQTALRTMVGELLPPLVTLMTLLWSTEKLVEVFDSLVAGLQSDEYGDIASQLSVVITNEERSVA